MRKRYLLKPPVGPVLKGLTVAGLLMTTAQSASADTICFAVADNDRDGNQDVLAKMYTDGRTEEVGSGLTGTQNMEAITFSLDGETLYAADGHQFGTLDVFGPANAATTAQFTPIGNGFGTGTCINENGEDEEITFDDVDSLTFDVATGVLYGTQRREHTSPKQYDVLFQIDPISGQYRPGVFFGDKDCVVVMIDGHPQYYDVDDIASDPTDGMLYIVANTGDGVESVLASLDKTTGVAMLKGVVATGGGQNIDDIESLSFDPNGILYGTTGNGGANKDNANPPTKDQLYQINKETAMAASLGKLMPPPEVGGITQHDFEAVSCVDETSLPPRGDEECVMYALHDEGKNDTQIIKIDPFAGVGQVGVVSTLGPMYRGLDLEGMAIIPCGNDNMGKLYVTSGYHAGKVKNGVVVEVAGEDGYLYEVDRISGSVIPIGSTGFSELSGLTYSPADGCLYAWARGKNRKNRYEMVLNSKGRWVYAKDQDGNKISKVGLVRICPDSPGSCEITATNGMVNAEILARFRPSFEKGSDTPDIEGLACSNDGTKIYGSADRELWVYDVATTELSPGCPDMVPAEVEALEMQPNGLLVLGTDGKKELGMVAYDPTVCQVIATRSFKNLIYDDIESIEWPALECQYRSWLYKTSFDAEIELIQYESVPAEVEAALRLALEDAGMDEAAIENDDGELTVYYAGMTLTAKPIETSQEVRALREGRDDSEAIEVSKAEFIAEAGGLRLAFEDNNGVMQSWGLFSVSKDVEGLVKSIEAVNGITKAKVENGTITVTLDDGQKLEAELGMSSTLASDSVQPGEALVQKGATELRCGEDFNNDDVPDCQVIYDNGTRQNIFVKWLVGSKD